MKRIVMLTIVAILVLGTLTGCIMIPQYKNFKIDPNTVQSIEIYDLCDLDSTSVGFLRTHSPLYEIPSDKVTSFLRDLAEITFSDTILIILAPTDPSFNFNEWTIRINYYDGSYELLSCDGYGVTYDKTGNKTDSHHFRCDQDEWHALIRKYLPQDIFNHSHKAA